MSDMNNKSEQKKAGVGFALPFFLVLTVLSVVSFVIPLRPTFSDSEKRELTKFPEFSLESLVSGDYFDEITLWFSDTFPGRERWISLSQYAASFHGYSEIAIEGPLTQLEEVPEENTYQPNTEPAPETQPDSEPQTTETGETTAPTEAQWGGVDVANKEINLGVVIQIGDAGFNQLAFSKPQSDRYIKSVNDFADRMAEKGVRVISAPAPTSVGVMIEPEYLEQLNCSDQNEIIGYLHDNMSENVVKVDTFSNLVEHNDEYIYFRTDHHWTALGAYYAYEALCEAAGFEAPPLDDFEYWNQGEFAGSLYGKVRWPRKLTIDTLECFVPQGNITMLAHFNAGSLGTEWPMIADRTNQDKNSRYSAFLAGDVPMAHIINEDNEGGPNCVVLKDSFGNCFVPYLSQNYHHVYALDYRKYWLMGLAEFSEKYDIDDVILAPYLIATQATDGNDMFRTHMR